MSESNECCGHARKKVRVIACVRMGLLESECVRVCVCKREGEREKEVIEKMNE